MHKRFTLFATPSQVHVPVTVDGVDILDSAGEIIVACFTPELADRLAQFINVDAVKGHGGFVGIEALTPSAFMHPMQETAAEREVKALRAMLLRAFTMADEDGRRSGYNYGLQRHPFANAEVEAVKTGAPVAGRLDRLCAEAEAPKS